MPVMEQRHERFGGYTVLIVSASSIRKQLDIYHQHMAPFWRAGACTQLDVEPWAQYNRPVNAEEVVDAYDYHIELFGREPMLYINPRQMPGVLEEVRAYRPDIILWEAHYGRTGELVARSNQATLHQYTSKYPAPGFTNGIDANTILRPADWDRACGLTDVPIPVQPPIIPPPVEDIDMNTAIIWSHKGYANAFLLGAGSALQLSPAAFTHYDKLGVMKVLNDEHPQMLASVLAQAGLRHGDLQPK